MTASEKLEVTSALQDMAACYSKPYTVQALESMVDGLEDLPLAAVLAGIRDAKRSCKFRPSVASIRECARLHQSTSRATVSAVTMAALSAGEVFCRICEDTGWVWTERETGRKLEAPPVGSHGDYRVAACPCRPENALYQARRQREGRQHRD